MANKYFGTDGIRGYANKFPMMPNVALQIGLAVGSIFRQKDGRARVVIGKDTRLSSYMIENALVAGFTSAGMDAFLLGPMPTPAMAMLCRSMRANIGVMISASHNPFYDNGIKLFGPDGYKLSDNLEKKIEQLLEKNLEDQMALNENIGRVKRVEGDIYRYIEVVKRTVERDTPLNGLRIVVDCANGAAYKTAPLVLWELGAEVIAIHHEPNGLNINFECGSTQPHALIEKVKEVRADIGIALDGDGDRVILVDENGHVIDGDQVLAVIAQFWLKNERLKGQGVVGTIMSNLGLETFLRGKNLALIRTPVGDRHIMEHMRKHGFNIGGEPSGHIILSEYNTTGDGLVAALQILHVMQKQQRKLSELCACFKPIPQISKNVPIRDKKILQKEAIQTLIKESETALKNTGRLIIRPSGTEPLIRIMIEAEDHKLAEELVDQFVHALRKF